MLQIIGVCRFAYPGLGMFAVEHETVEDRQAFLWSPERMEARFRSLEHICLRSLSVQSDPDFKFLILTGDALPEPYRERLLELAKRVPGAEVVFHPAMQQQDALSQVIRARVDVDGPPVMYFRQDDDDGVASRFIGRSREIFAEVSTFWEQQGRMCIDYNRGFRINLNKDRVRVQPLVEHHTGVAQAIILRPDNPRTGMHFPHHKLATLMPCLTITHQPMWLRGVDDTNDSQISARLGLLKPATEEQQGILERRFGLDFEAISASFEG